MRCPGLAFLSLILIPVGCAQVAPQAQSPSAYPEVAPAPIEAPAPAANLAPLPAGPAPTAGPCSQAPVADPRCPSDVLTAAAMSYLDKTVAEFDGHSMKVIEYDRDDLLAEAYGDAGFRRLLQNADAAPADGVLDHAESRELESSVLRLCDARLAAR